MRELENDATSGCFGCGPANPRGLKLKFFQVGATVQATHTVGPDETGWPLRLHGGLMYTIMLEVAYWTLLGLKDQIGAPTALSVEMLGLPTVGSQVLARGSMDEETEAGPKITVEAQDPHSGKVLARLRSQWRPLSRAEGERLGFDPSMMEHLKS